MSQERTHHSVAVEGQPVDTVQVNIGPLFLERFSEQMYSSPNKAFEELISNSWDAGATSIYVSIPSDLAGQQAAVWVLDNGGSMDIHGLHDLWNIAVSRKPGQDPVANRSPIGKFGLGKLATYILADEVTYICHARDGRIRAVTMDYERVRQSEGLTAGGGDSLQLEVREIDQMSLSDLLLDIPERTEILRIIEDGIPRAGCTRVGVMRSWRP